MIRTASIAAFAVALVTTTSVAQSAVQTGILECHADPSINLITGSRVTMICVFTPNSGPPQGYGATGGRIGLELGNAANRAFVWAVFARSNVVARGALAGNYGSVSSGKALGLGVGANTLVGGMGKSIALRPVSVEGQVGVSLAAAIVGLTLKYYP